MHLDTEDVVALARAIEASRPQAAMLTDHPALRRWGDAQVDRTARSVADTLFPCAMGDAANTRRLFLISAGVEEDASRVSNLGCSGASWPAN